MTPPRWQRLTQRQEEVREALQRFVAEQGYPPTARELSDACRLGGPAGAQRMLGELERKGYLRRTPGRSRAITLVSPPLGLDDLDESQLPTLSVVLEAHGLVRDRLLSAAARVPDLTVKNVLVVEAQAHHAYARDLHERLGRATPSPAGQRNLADLVVLLRPELNWPEFLVDLAVFNRYGASLSGLVAESSSPLHGVLQRSRVLCERLADVADDWLGRLLQAHPEHALREMLRRRAFVVGGMCTKAATRVVPSGGPPDKAALTTMALPAFLREA